MGGQNLKQKNRADARYSVEPKGLEKVPKSLYLKAFCDLV